MDPYHKRDNDEGCDTYGPLWRDDVDNTRWYFAKKRVISTGTFKLAVSGHFWETILIEVVFENLVDKKIIRSTNKWPTVPMLNIAYSSALGPRFVKDDTKSSNSDVAPQSLLNLNGHL